MEIVRKSGPFTFTSGRIININGTPSRKWRMTYGQKELAEKTILSANTAMDELHDTFGTERTEFERHAKSECAPNRIDLVDFETGDAVASFDSYSMCGMTPGLINDGSRLWLRSSDRKYSRDVTLNEFARIAVECEALPLAWVAGLLPDEVLADDVAEWQPPTAWQIRHVVGEGSFSGVSGAAAAALVGVTPQNFRKYTAADDSSTRQRISFAMWHLLLQKLGVKRA